MSTYSDTDEEWQLEGATEVSHEPMHPGFQGDSDHLRQATDREAPGLAAHDDAHSVVSTAPDAELGEDFENVSTEDLDQQIQQLTLQNQQINVDDDSSSAAGHLSRQGLELQVETLRAQNLTLQRELLNLPPQAPALQASAAHSPAPSNPARVDLNPFNPSPATTQRSTSPTPTTTSQASASSGLNAVCPIVDAKSWTASFPAPSSSPPVRPVTHVGSPQAGRGSPVNPMVPSATQAANEPLSTGSSISAPAQRSCLTGPEPGSGPASPRSTLNGPSARGSPMQPSAHPAVAPEELEASQSGAGIRYPTRLDADAVMAAVAQRRKDAEVALIRLQAEQGGLEVRRDEAAQATQRMERILKGLDLAFLFDVTGSMEPWIRQAATKAKQIMDVANQIHPQAVMRMAFVGYRDYGDVQRYEIMDFVEKEGFPALQRFLDGIVAKGGDDSTEDIAGGLKAVTELSWRSSTRLVIHFGDYPCHGKKYHGEEWEQYDRYPVGDPEGLIPEDYLEWLASKRTDYYFAELTPHTAKMANIFQGSFANAANATFHKMNLNRGPEEFMPKVIDSIRSSMAKSSVFGPAAAHPAAEDGSRLQPAIALGTPFGPGTSSLGTATRRRPRTARNLGTD
ncbi:hypothetical protein WJX74_003293 [Apatococcus lobatus]|uniref:VWFA domain-containing protein n=1 Tax=Apatococcus lobatus TaxID=904363 RepID=A0AAW1RT88_9CHLO